MNSTAQYPKPAYAWYVVAVLTAAYVLSFLDRQLLSLLAGPIKQSMSLSDSALGLLMGPFFAVFYVVLGIPAGILADRRSRRTIITAGITLWCLMTALCGLARNYGQLAAARVGVGVGEATLTPSAYSLISDYFPRERRSQAIGVFMMGISAGMGLAYLIGGKTVAYLEGLSRVNLPVVGELEPWQSAFVIVGLAGLIVAVLVLTVAGPVRQERVAGQSSSFSALRRYVRSRKAGYACLFFSMSVSTVIGYAWLWLPVAFTRVWGWTVGEMSLGYGIILLLFGPLGSIFGGWLASYWYRAGQRDGAFRAAVIALLAMVLTGAAVPLMPNGYLALAVMVPSTFAGAMASGAGASALVTIAPARFRAQLSAWYLLTLSLMGLFVGPTVVGVLNDHVFVAPDGVRYSLVCVSGVLGGLLLFVATRAKDSYVELVIETEQAHSQNEIES